MRGESKAEEENQFEKMGEIVSEKLEQIARDNGTLTRTSVQEMFKSQFQTFESSMKTSIAKTVEEALSNAGFESSQTRDEDSLLSSERVHGNDGSMMYTYDGGFFFVPKDFNFPNNVTMKSAWRLWLLGMSFKGKYPVRPFLKFTTKGFSPCVKI